MGKSGISIPTGTPEIHKQFQLTEFGENHNKQWIIRAWAVGLDYTIETQYGRVGNPFQSNIRTGLSNREVNNLIAEKRKKGYVEVDLHVPTQQNVQPSVVPGVQTVITPSVHPKVNQVVDIIFRAAGESINKYLATKVDALSQAQIQRGRTILAHVKTEYDNYLEHTTTFDALIAVVKEFYNNIPTQLPAKLRDKDVLRRVVFDFCEDFQEQENRLDQLEAGLATFTVSGSTTQNSNYVKLGAEINVLDTHDPQYVALLHFIKNGERHNYHIKVLDIYTVKIPSERQAYEQSTSGKSLVIQGTHGTSPGNVRHILHEKGIGSGLKIPKTAANGWAYGKGIYYAKDASKSFNYCGYSDPRLMFISRVALGNKYKALRSITCDKPPAGYDSVWGVTQKDGGYLQYDEFVVFKQEQQTIDYLIVAEKGSSR